MRRRRFTVRHAVLLSITVCVICAGWLITSAVRPVEGSRNQTTSTAGPYTAAIVEGICDAPGAMTNVWDLGQLYVANPSGQAPVSEEPGIAGTPPAGEGFGPVESVLGQSLGNGNVLWGFVSIPATAAEVLAADAPSDTVSRAIAVRGSEELVIACGDMINRTMEDGTVAPFLFLKLDQQNNSNFGGVAFLQPLELGTTSVYLFVTEEA